MLHGIGGCGGKSFILPLPRRRGAIKLKLQRSNVAKVIPAFCGVAVVYPVSRVCPREFRARTYLDGTCVYT